MASPFKFSSVLPRPSELVSGMGDALTSVPQEPAAIPESYQVTPDQLDDEAEDLLVRVAHACGVHPIEFIRIIHNGRAAIAPLDGFQEQSMQFADPSALSTPVATVDLTVPANWKELTALNGYAGVALVGGALEITIFRGANTESGEIVLMEITGRRATPELRQLVAGRVYRIPWSGMFTQGHKLRFRSPQADATNPVQVTVTARARAIGIQEIRAARHLGGLRGVVGRLSEWGDSARAKLAMDLSKVTLSQAIPEIVQRIGDGSLLAKAKSGAGTGTRGPTGGAQYSALGRQGGLPAIPIKLGG